MKAAVQQGHGAVITDIAIPRPGPLQVLVKVRACSMNRADLGVIAGHAHGAVGGAGTVVGMEWAGDVVEVGDQVRAYKAGDRVMGSGIGGFAEYTCADWRMLFPMPTPDISYQDAACLPIALRTMHDALVNNGRLERGQSVLIQGASSGVGLMALQIARLLGAGLVIGTSTNAQRRAQLAQFGAGLAIDSSDAAWPEQVLAATEGRGVDLVVDQLAGPVMNQNLRATAIKGRIVNVGRMAGVSAPFDFDLHALRRIQYIGVTFRTRSIDEVAAISDGVRRDLWPALQARQLRLPVHQVFALDQLADAVAMMKANQHFGKILLIP